MGMTGIVWDLAEIFCLVSHFGFIHLYVHLGGFGICFSVLCACIMVSVSVLVFCLFICSSFVARFSWLGMVLHFYVLGWDIRWVGSQDCRGVEFCCVLGQVGQLIRVVLRYIKFHFVSFPYLYVYPP